MRWAAIPLSARHAYISYLLFNIVDLLMTGLILRAGGEEANPLGAYLLIHHGAGAFICAKLLLVVVAIACCEMLRSLHALASTVVIRTGVLVYFGLLLWECRLLIHCAPRLLNL